MKDHSASRGIFSKQPEVTDFSYCLEHEDKVLGVGGIQMINHSTSWVWLDLTDNFKDHVPTVYRIIKEWMEILCKQKGIKRLQAYILPDFPEAMRMVEHLGFLYESRMEKFADDKDAFMYKKIME